LCGAVSSPPKYGYNLNPLALTVVLVLKSESVNPFNEKT
jgi:hypothetical protein